MHASQFFLHFDINQVIEVAGKTGTALEINAYTERLDLDDINCMKAKQKGVKIAIGTDAIPSELIGHDE